MTVVRDLDLLVPAFGHRVRLTLAALRANNFDPIVWETYRSPERALELVKAGKSKAKGGRSMHCYHVAADIICVLHKWGCKKHGCGFFEALGINAERQGLTWGGRWRMVDLPHIQAIPVRLQDQFRALAGPSRESFLQAFYKSVGK